MKAKALEQLPRLAAVVLVVLVVAACAIHLRSDEGRPDVPSAAEVTPDPLATKLAECRSVTYEQKEALSECRKAWAEKRRQFLGRKAAGPSDGGSLPAGPSLFVGPEDESRLPSGYPAIQQTGKE